MFRYLRGIIKKLFAPENIPDGGDCIEKDRELIKMLTSRDLVRNVKGLRVNNIREAEFRIFSQWGDDGIIQYLINNADISCRTFIEFGVEDYREANTRFLLINDNWRGLILDASMDNISRIKKDDIYWKYDLTAKAAWVTGDNIDRLIEGAGFSGDIGLLSIDVDGNDYWIWKAVKAVSPEIVVIEYNSVFGSERAITVPYDETFCRTKAHYSNLYYGASLMALCDLGKEKGYDFVGCNSNGNNAYFIKKGISGKVRTVSPEQGYVLSRFRESRGHDGRLTYVSGNERLELMKGLKVYNTRKGAIEKL